jgi:protein-S-isoprenylcysteine O-methyltransferase Ste14
MKLDIRMPMGLMFVIVGLILVVYGALTNSNTEMYTRSLGTNINLGWGLVLFFIGVTMVVLARRAMRTEKK